MMRIFIIQVHDPVIHLEVDEEQSMLLLFKRKIRTHLDLLSIPQSGGKSVKTFRWDHRLQIQNLFVAFKRVPLW